MVRFDVGELVEVSRFGTEELSVDWRIPDFMSLLHNSCLNVICFSPNFTIGNVRWRLTMRTDMDTERQNPASGWVRLNLHRELDESPRKTFYFRVGIRGSGGVEKRREGEREFLEFSDYYNWNDFCSRSELIEHRKRLMPDDTLTITCVLKIPGAARGGMKVIEDITKLLASGEGSDITIQVGDAEFKAHSCILLARSPALSVSLRHECTEKSSNRIVIEDCEPEVFGDFLQYLYTGSVQLLTEKNVFGLYQVADKYLADDLKRECLECIRDSLSVETFYDTMTLALMYGESRLLELATDFATKHFHSLGRSEEWQNFFSDYPSQAIKILIKCYLPT